MKKLQKSWSLLLSSSAFLFLVACQQETGEPEGGAVEKAESSNVQGSTDPSPTIDAAIAKGDIELVKQILAENPETANVGSRPSMPPLHQSILRKRSEIALLLLQSGANVNALDSSKRTPLHLCVERDLPDLVKPLVEAGAKTAEGDDAGWTPLHLAGAKDRVEVAKILIENGADIDARSNLGGTPLHEAAASGSAEIIQIYIDAGVDTSVVAEGGTALDIAVKFENQAAVELLSEKKGEQPKPAAP